MATLIPAGEAGLSLTLLEPMHLPPTLPPGLDSLDPPCPGQEVPRSLRQQGSWTRQAGEEPVDIMFLPRNGKVGMFLGQEQSSGTSMPRERPLPFPCCPEPRPSMLGLRGWKTHEGEVARSARSPWHICPRTYRAHSLTQEYPHSRHTRTQRHADILTGVLRNTLTHPQPHGQALICIHLHTRTLRS